jgi:hypothetical protein
MLWTKEADRLLIKLWDAGGGLTYCADEMRKAGYDVSRGAIAGRRFRLPHGSFKRPVTARKRVLRPAKFLARITESKRKPVSAPVPRRPTDAEITALSRVGGVDYFDNVNGCAATLEKFGRLGLPMVCGEPVTEDYVGNRTSYCLTHFRLFHHPTRPMMVPAPFKFP